MILPRIAHFFRILEMKTVVKFPFSVLHYCKQSSHVPAH